MKTTEINKLIAEFMGLSTKGTYNIVTGEHEPFTFEYHTSWDALMPVVEKIESIEDYLYDVEIRQSVCFIHGADIEIQSDAKIDAVYWAVVDFIEWYNKQL